MHLVHHLVLFLLLLFLLLLLWFFLFGLNIGLVVLFQLCLSHPFIMTAEGNLDFSNF